jgi:hypothetical protein
MGKDLEGCGHILIEVLTWPSFMEGLRIYHENFLSGWAVALPRIYPGTS